MYRSEGWREALSGRVWARQPLGYHRPLLLWPQLSDGRQAPCPRLPQPSATARKNCIGYSEADPLASCEAGFRVSSTEGNCPPVSLLCAWWTRGPSGSVQPVVLHSLPLPLRFSDAPTQPWSEVSIVLKLPVCASCIAVGIIIKK